VIYFLRSSDYVKIGYASSEAGVDRRIAGFRTANPTSLKLIAVHAGDRRFEAQLHRKFRAHRVRGEWFIATAEIIDFAVRGIDFRSWVAALPVTDDPIGDFVSDLIDDESFPRGISCFDVIDGYLSWTRRACPEALKAAGALWRRYLSECHVSNLTCPDDLWHWADPNRRYEDLCADRPLSRREREDARRARDHATIMEGLGL